MSYFKTKPVRSKKLRDAARGEACTIGLPCCDGGGETSVLAHLPDESHGISRKSDDISACIGCDPCHAVIDGRDRNSDSAREFQEHREFYMRRAQTRTWRRLYELGLIVIKGAA